MAQLLIAGLAGTAVTLAVFLPFGVLLALLAAPFGGGIAILLLANFGKDEKPEPIREHQRETLAEMRSRESLFMNKFRNPGLIDDNSCIEIRSSLLNVVLRDEPHIKERPGNGV